MSDNLSFKTFEKFKVGFNLRRDTYTNKLGFINHMINGEYQLGRSYSNWIDSSVPEEEYDNDFVSGFIINNNIGYMSYGNGREPKVRVLDPRGFEIELTMSNFFHLISFGVQRGKMINGRLKYILINNRLSLIHEDDKDNLLKVSVSEIIEVSGDEPFVVGKIYYIKKNPEQFTNKYIYLGLHSVPYKVTTNFDIENNTNTISKVRYKEIPLFVEVYANKFSVGSKEDKIDYITPKRIVSTKNEVMDISNITEINLDLCQYQTIHTNGYPDTTKPTTIVNKDINLGDVETSKRVYYSESITLTTKFKHTIKL